MEKNKNFPLEHFLSVTTALSDRILNYTNE